MKSNGQVRSKQILPAVICTMSIRSWSVPANSGDALTAGRVLLAASVGADVKNADCKTR